MITRGAFPVGLPADNYIMSLSLSPDQIGSNSIYRALESGCAAVRSGTVHNRPSLVDHVVLLLTVYCTAHKVHPLDRTQPIPV